MKRRSKNIIIIIGLLLLLLPIKSCVEEFSPGTLSFEDAIVIEATITNELKHQKILISRTFRLEEKFGSEPNALVQVSSGNETFIFSESKSGEYLSDIQFKAEPNKEYILSITTSDGKKYTSKKVQLTESTSTIENVYARREFDTGGIEGIGIYVDSFDDTGNSTYYAYEHEETYQIIAQFWNPWELEIVSEAPPDLLIVEGTEEGRICYSKTNLSNGRLLTSTKQLSEDRVSEFLVKFIPLDDIALSSRYSLLVKQFTQSELGFEFTKTLNEFSSVESLLSQIQTGFVNGNISGSEDELVVGFFEVSAVTEKRLFFNRREFMEDSFFWGTECNINSYSIDEVISRVRANTVKFVSQRNLENGEVVYDVVQRYCGDCTRLGSSIRPDFWED
jgi:hypothetical protein